MPWIVISTYYKYGEYDVKYFKTEDDCKDYLVKTLIEYEDYGGCSYDYYQAHDMSFKQLVKKVIKRGEYMVDNECGTGIREIIHVDNEKIISYNIFTS